MLCGDRSGLRSFCPGLSAILHLSIRVIRVIVSSRHYNSAFRFGSRVERNGESSGS